MEFVQTHAQPGAARGAIIQSDGGQASLRRPGLDDCTQVARIAHQVQRCQVPQQVGQTTQRPARPPCPLDAAVARRAEGDQILQSVGESVQVVSAANIAKGAEGGDVVDVMSAALPLGRATLDAAASIARAGRVPLDRPVGAIVDRRCEHAGILQTRRDFLGERQPIANRAPLLLRQINGRPGQHLVGIALDLAVTSGAGGDQEFTTGPYCPRPLI